MSVLFYGYTTWTLTKHLEEKKLDKNYTRMLHAILNKSWKQRPLKQQYGHLSPISQTTQDVQDMLGSSGEAGICSPADSYSWTHLCWLTSKDLHTSALCGGWMLSRRPSRSNEQEEQIAREWFWGLLELIILIQSTYYQEKKES